MKYHEDIAEKSDYVKNLEKNCYKNVQRIIILKRIAIITFACFMVIVTIIIGTKIMNDIQSDRSEQEEQPPKAEKFLYLDYHGNIIDENKYTYLWDEKNDIVYQYFLTYEMTPVAMKNKNGKWMSREDLITSKNKT